MSAGINLSDDGEVEWQTESPFTREGFMVFKEEVGEYIVRLHQDSDLLRKASGSDKISASDVRTSGQRILNKKLAKRISLLNTVGGTLFGIALSNVAVTIATPNAVSHPFFLVTVGAGVVGGLMLGYGFLKD